MTSPRCCIVLWNQSSYPNHVKGIVIYSTKLTIEAVGGGMDFRGRENNFLSLSTKAGRSKKQAFSTFHHSFGNPLQPPCCSLKYLTNKKRKSSLVLCFAGCGRCVVWMELKLVFKAIFQKTQALKLLLQEFPWWGSKRLQWRNINQKQPLSALHSAHFIART